MLFRNFSLRLEDIGTLQYSSDNLPSRPSVSGFMQNCLNDIPMYRFHPIAGHNCFWRVFIKCLVIFFRQENVKKSIKLILWSLIWLIWLVCCCFLELQNMFWDLDSHWYMIWSDGPHIKQEKSHTFCLFLWFMIFFYNFDHVLLCPFWPIYQTNQCLFCMYVMAS